MEILIQDLETAADLIVRRRQHWIAPPWLSDSRLQRGGKALVLEQVEGQSSGNLIEVVGFWQQSHIYPDIVRLCIAKRPKASVDHPSNVSLFESKPGTSQYFRIDSAENAQLYAPQVWHRNKAGVESRKQKYGFYCHLLLREGKTSMTFSDQQGKKQLKCPGCSWAFYPSPALQGYCCGKCAMRQSPRARHGEDCTRIVPPKSRRLRRLLKDAVSGTRLEPYENLIATEETPVDIFLQLAIYAARTGVLSRDEENEIFRRFSNRFKKKIGKLKLGRLRGQSAADTRQDILNDAWMNLRKNYGIPSVADGFSHYVHRLLHTLKNPHFSPETANSELIDKKRENPGLKKRKGDHLFTTEDHGDREHRERVLEDRSPQMIASRLGISRSTFYRHIQRGKIPAIQTGKRIQVATGAERAVLEWEQTQEVNKQRAQDNKIFAHAWAEQQKIGLPSATTHIKRLRLKGLSTQEIERRIGTQYVQQAKRALATEEDDK